MAKSLHFFTPSSNLTLPLQQYHHQPFLKPSLPTSHRRFPVTLRSRRPILTIKASSSSSDRTSSATGQLVLERGAGAFSSPSSSSYYSSAPEAADSSSMEVDAVMEAELNGSRSTKLICTIGPATCGFEQLEALAVGGMKVARINTCHGTREWHRRVIERVRRLNEEKGFAVAIMLDTKCSEIHMSDLGGAPSSKAEDWLDIDFGIAERVDFLAISSVKSAELIYHLKSYIAARSPDSDIAVIAKIESLDSLKNLEEIIQASDGAMVVRGDLGAQIPLEQVASAQQKVVQLCRQLNKPVIAASHLLENQKDSENDAETYLEEDHAPNNEDEWAGHPALESNSKKKEQPLSDDEKEALHQKLMGQFTSIYKEMGDILDKILKGDGEEEENPGRERADWETDEKPYKKSLDHSRNENEIAEAIQTGIGHLNGIPVAVGVMDFDFIGGSMGSVVGEKITRLIEHASRELLPLILICASGGARMQEGSLSLMQMAKISCALRDYAEKKLLYITILTSPTTGGVIASFGMLGDIIIAEPGATLAFAGKRVIEETLKVEVPEGAQTTEVFFENGLVDLIVPRNMLKGVLHQLLELHNF